MKYGRLGLVGVAMSGGGCLTRGKSASVLLDGASVGGLSHHMGQYERTQRLSPGDESNPGKGELLFRPRLMRESELWLCGGPPCSHVAGRSSDEPQLTGSKTEGMWWIWGFD